MKVKVDKLLGTVREGLDYTNYLGSDCTSTSNKKNRKLTTKGVTLVIVDNQLLHPIIDYTVSNKIITFLNEIWNDQNITVFN